MTTSTKCINNPRKGLPIKIDIDDRNIFSAGSLRTNGLYSSVLRIKFLEADPCRIKFLEAGHARVFDQLSIAAIIASVTDPKPGWMKSIKRPYHHAASIPFVRRILMHREKRTFCVVCVVYVVYVDFVCSVCASCVLYVYVCAEVWVFSVCVYCA